MKLRTTYSLILLALVLGISLVFATVTHRTFQGAMEQVARAHATIATATLRQQLNWHAETLIKVLGEHLVNPLYLLDVVAMRDVLTASLQAEPDLLELQVFDAEGVLFCGGSPGALSFQPVRVDPEWVAALGQPHPLMREHPLGLEALTAIRLAGEPLGGVRLLFSTGAIQGIIGETQGRIFALSAQELERQLWFAGGVLLVLSGGSLLLVLVVARRLVAPIHQLIEASRGLRDGDLLTPVTLRRRDEFAQLAETLDHMRLNILGSYESLQRKNRELSAQRAEIDRVAHEKAVAEATARAKGLFLATMSHELRTPMNVVIGMGDVLMESGLTPEQAGYLRKQQEAGNTLLQLIDQILDLTRIEAGQLQLVAEPVRVRELLGEVTGLVRVLAGAKGVEVEWRVERAAPEWILADRVRLRQVLFNLLGNAIKFTDRGTITLWERVEGEHTLCLAVEDTGIGIDPLHLERIFDPFTQADDGITRRFGGSGLGLSITRHLVGLMGGEIKVESRPGVGSTFHLTLPLRPATPPAPTPLPETLSPPSDRSLRILLVEDAEDNRLLIRTFLKNSSHCLQMAGNGEEAVRLVREHPPFDLVFMDVQMPIMDGYTATRLIRDWERESGRAPLPIVSLTAHALEGEAQRSAEAGCDLYLTKPIRKQRLLEVIRQMAPPGGVSGVTGE